MKTNKKELTVFALCAYAIPFLMISAASSSTHSTQKPRDSIFKWSVFAFRPDCRA